MFTIEDVDKHKKNLTDRGKKQWMRIANSVIKAEVKKGKKEEDAAISAIKQANGVVINVNESKGQFSSYKEKQILNYETKLALHQEKAHLVAPVVMMVEGVHNGSQGAIYHPISELGKFPESWNGIPIVVYHPEQDGHPVSANSPDIIDSVTVGRVYNTNVDGSKLRAEAWFDEDRLNNVSPQTLQDIDEGKAIEVSLGMFTENEDSEGEWNGEQYVAIARNHRPDHLAILPDQVGACSVADGAGVGVNSKKDEKKPCKNEEEDDEDEDDVNVIKDKVTTNSVTRIKDIQSSSKEDAGAGDSSNKFKKEDKKMSKTSETPNLAKINALIANAASPWKESDREWLLTQEEVVLDKLAPVVQEVEKVVERTVEVNKFSAEDQADLAWARKLRKEKKESTIKTILDNTEGVWDVTVLSAMNDDTLERVAKSIKKEVIADYSLQANVQSNAGGVEPLLPAGVSLTK